MLFNGMVFVAVTTVLIIPAVFTLRIAGVTTPAITRTASVKNRFPAVSTAKPPGAYNTALVAGPPSPDGGLPVVPLPAIVLMIPAVFTLRIRPFTESLM